MRSYRPPAAPRRSWLDVERWSDPDKVLLASGVTLPFAIGWVARMHALAADPTLSPYLSRAFFPTQIAFTWIQALGHLALVLAALAMRRGARRQPWLVHAEIQLWFACASFSIYTHGPFTSPYLVLLLVLPVTGYLLFDPHPMRLGVLQGAVGMTAAIVLPALGLVPYAPFLETSPFEHGYLQRGWMLAVGAPALFSIAAVLGVFTALVRRLRERQRELEHLSSTDALTGLANRRVLFERLEEEIARARRHGHALSLLVLDVDNFKALNDTHGHLAGDAVLRALAARVREALRIDDLAARHGGEELAVLLPHTALEGAHVVAERILRAARTVRPAEDAGPATVSIGVAELGAGETADALMARADAALYDSKRSGRDRATRAAPPA